MLFVLGVGVGVWGQTGIAAPAQQWSNRPKHRSSPNADERHTDGVQADAVSCRNRRKYMDMSVEHSVGSLKCDISKHRTEKVRGTKVMQHSWLVMNVKIVTFIEQWGLILAAFANISDSKEPLLAKYTLLCTQEEKVHQSARLVSEQLSINTSGCSHSSHLTAYCIWWLTCIANVQSLTTSVKRTQTTYTGSTCMRFMNNHKHCKNSFPALTTEARPNFCIIKTFFSIS